MARARTRIRRLGALVALLLLTTVALSALSHPAGAQIKLPDGDDAPSCSLFPTRLGVGQWFFTNRRDFPITIGITRADGEVVFAGTLEGGESTPTFALTSDTLIHWAGDVYHLSAYDLVNCLEIEGPLPTTTTEAPPTTVPDTTPSTAPPEPTTTAPITTEPPTTAPPAEAPASTVASTTEATETLAPITAPVAVQGVAVVREETAPAAVLSRGDSLPTTGFPVGLAALGAVAVILAGLTCLAVSRRPA